MDNHNYNEPYPNVYHKPGSGQMAKAAFILSICSLIFALSGLGVTFAVTGIILGLLSRGRGKVQRPAKNAIRISVIGLIIGGIIMVSSFVTVGREFSKMNWNDIMENYEDILPDEYNIPSDDAPKSL